MPPCVAMDVGKGCRMDKQAVELDVAVVRVIMFVCLIVHHNHTITTTAQHTQTVNAAAATIEAFVERRKHVLLEVIESLRSSFPRKEKWDNEKCLFELAIDPIMMQLVDKIKKYVTSTRVRTSTNSTHCLAMC